MRPQQRRIAVISLGCHKNRVDTEVMLGQLLKAGYEPVADPVQADLFLINTCCFIREATEESFEAIAEVIEGWKRRKPGARLVVTGCLGQRYGKVLLKKFPEIDAVIGVQALGMIASVCNSLTSGGGKGQILVNDPCQLDPSVFFNRVPTSSPHSVFIKIADGCDNRCSYCIIPSIRGPYRSRKIGDIVREASILADRGAREINLIAQDTTNYGQDLTPPVDLVRLIESLAEIGGVEWIRLLYAHPLHITEELIDLMATHPKVCRYLDIPLQHCSDRILRRMNRKGTKKELLGLIERLRERIPGLVLRTTFMVGFPGETEEDFIDLLDFIQRIRFERLGAFRYSRERGTLAARLSPQVKPWIKDDRWHRLMTLQRQISLEYNRSLIDSVQMVMIDSINPQAEFPLIGRTAAHAPEVDGQVYIKTDRIPRGLRPGDMIPVRISAATDYDLIGEPLN